MRRVDLAAEIEALDSRLFDPITAQISDWDRRSLLALHAAVARATGQFTYLEVGSYLGGSLQVLMRDPRCARVLSIDPRPAVAPDKRGAAGWEYEDNSTEHMLRLLSGLPDADLSKLTTFEADTSELTVDDLPARPDYCFIDGEHTDEAVLRDARFCAEATGGQGVIAFHDDTLVRPGIRAFLDEVWKDVSLALAFNGLVFACELGDRGILRSPVITRAVGSSWHSALWSITSRAPSPRALMAAWRAIPPIDTAVYRIRAAVGRG